VDEELTHRPVAQGIWSTGLHLSAEVRAVTPQIDRLLLDLGVQTEDLRQRLVQRVLRRLQSQVERDRPSGLALAEHAVRETFAFIDDWIARAVAMAGAECSDLMPLRAALVHGALPDWPQALLSPPLPGICERLLAAAPRPLPAAAPLAMPTAELRLRRFRPLAWLLRCWPRRG